MNPDDNDKVEQKNICKCACIFNLKVGEHGKYAVKSKSKNSESDGFPTIEYYYLAGALKIAKKSDGVVPFRVGEDRYEVDDN